MALWQCVKIPPLQTPPDPDCAGRALHAWSVQKLSLQHSSKGAAEEPSSTSPALLSHSCSFIPSSFTHVLPNECHRSGFTTSCSLCNSDFVCGRGSLWGTLSVPGAFQYPASRRTAPRLLRLIFQATGIPTTGCGVKTTR